MKRVIIAAVLVCTISATPAYSQAAFDFDTEQQGIDQRYTRGVITKERDDEFATVTVTPVGYQWGRYSFAVAVFNKLGQPVMIGSENVHVTMWDGSSVAVLSGDDVVRIAKKKATWARIGEALAGNDGYGTTTSTTYGSGNGSVYGYGGSATFNYNDTSTTTTTTYDPSAAARQQYRLNQIQVGLDGLIADVGNRYLSTTTVSPGSGFAGLVVVDKMKFRKPQGEKVLRKLFLMTVTVGDHNYRFPFGIEE